MMSQITNIVEHRRTEFEDVTIIDNIDLDDYLTLKLLEKIFNDIQDSCENFDETGDFAYQRPTVDLFQKYRGKTISDYFNNYKKCVLDYEEETRSIYVPCSFIQKSKNYQYKKFIEEIQQSLNYTIELETEIINNLGKREDENYEKHNKQRMNY